jgi:ferrous iron transport protein A
VTPRKRDRNGPRAELGKDETVPLTRLPAGTRVCVVSVAGGHGIRHRLALLGIRPGTEIRKISSLLLRGPVIVEVGGRQVAIGFGMAHRIAVKPVGNGE